MRSVKLTFGPGQALVVATILATGCGGEAENSRNATATGGQNGIGGQNESGGASGTHVGNGGTHIGNGGATTTTGGTISGLCATAPEQYMWAQCSTETEGAPTDYPFRLETPTSTELCVEHFVVPVAPEGTPPTVTELCAATDTPTSSGWAARVTLTESDPFDGTATGRVTLASELELATVSSVKLTIVEQDPGFGRIVVGTVTRQGNAFVFQLNFEHITSVTTRFPRVIITANLTLDCNGTPRTIVSTTALYRCDVPYNSSAWISSGDSCGECAVICEMAASPILPPLANSDEPLRNAVRAQVTRIGQYGSALLIQAQHDGGADRFSYEWDISAGRILWQEKDLLLWQPPSSHGEHLLQVSLLANDAAVVASSRLRSHPLEGA